MFNLEEKKRILFVSTLFLIALFLYVNLFVITQVNDSEVIEKNLILKLPNEERLLREMLLWPNLVKAVHAGNWSISQDKESIDALYFRDCWNDKDWIRLYADPYCTYLWMRIMEHSEVSSLDMILAVITNGERDEGVEAKHNQNGGMRCSFDNESEFKIKGYWKPCTSSHLPQNSESFTAEIIAFYIDRILGFYRTPVVVPRTFLQSDFSYLSSQAINREVNADLQADSKLKTVLDKCGDNHHSFSEGALVGWTNTIVETLDQEENGELREEKLVNMFDKEGKWEEHAERFSMITNQSPREEIEWAMENVAVNLFALLMGNTKKFSHSVFIMAREGEEGREYGPLLYIDNDRSIWSKNLMKRSVFYDHPIAKICKFPRSIAEKVLLLYSKRNEGISLGRIVKECANTYPSLFSSPLFTELEVGRLNSRVNYIASSIIECIHLHGIDSVFIDDPFNSSYDNVDILSDLLSSF